MSSVDNRIVNMQFNNKQFESGATQSTRTLASLEAAVGKTAKSKGLEGMASSVDNVKNHFGAMKIAGVTAIATIANRATDMALHLAKSLTIDPIKAGLESYNQQINATQVILSNTKAAGVKLPQVTATLKELQQYANLTVYNFSEMTTNIGKFTAAGVPLKAATASIKGMANVAALSGANTQQMASAMYQMSQALSTGVIRLQDWNSLANANMAGTNIQKALEATARTMGDNGKAMDAAIKKGGNFRNSLQQGWLTSGIFNKTMKIMGGTIDETTGHMKAFTVAQIKQMGYSEKDAKTLHELSKSALDSAIKIRTLPQLMQALKEEVATAWGTIFKAIFGDINQATAMFTKIHTVAENMLTIPLYQFAQMLELWSKMGGRMALFKALGNIFKSLGSIIGSVKDAFRDVFPPSSAKNLVAITQAFENFTAKLVPSKQVLSNLRDIFGGVFAVLHIGVSIVTGIAAGFGAMFGAMFQGSGKAGGGVLALLATVGKLLKGFDQMLTSGGKMKDFFVTVGTVIGNALHPVVAIIASVVAALGKLGGAGGGPGAFFDSITSAMSGLASNGGKISGVFSAIGGSFKSLDPSKVTSAFKSIGDSFKSLDPSKVTSVFKSISDAFSTINPEKVTATFKSLGKSVGNFAGHGVALASGLISGLVSGLASAAPQVFASLVKLGASIIQSIKDALGVHSPSTKMIPVGIGVMQGLIKGILEGLKQLPSFIAHSAGAIVHGFAAAFKSLFGGLNALDLASVFNAVLTGAILLTVKKVVEITLSWKKIVQDVVDGLTNSLKAMQQGVKAYAIKQIAIAVALLAASVIALSFIDPKKIAISIGAIGTMVGILVGAIAALGKLDKGEINLTVIGASIAMIAGAILTLAGAVAILGRMDMKTLAKGVGAVAIMLGVISGSLALLGNAAKISLGAGPAILAIAFAINIMVLAVVAFGNMDMGTLAKGMGAVAIGLGLMVASLMILSSGSLVKQLASSGLALVLVATSLGILAAVVALFGNMDMGTLVKGFAAMAIGLTLLTASLLILSDAGPFVILAAAGMVMMAKAMILMVPVIAILGNMDWGTLAKGIGALAVVLTLFVVAIAALGAIADVVGPGLIMLGAALALAGVGMLAFGTGFALLAAAGTAGVAVLTAAFTAIIALLPALAAQLAAAILAMVQTFAKAAPPFRKAMDIIIKNLLQIITDNIPHLAKLFTTMALAGIAALKKVVPKFVEMGFTIIDKFLQSANKHAPSIINSVSKLIVTFLNGIANNMGKITNAGVNLILKFVGGLTKAINSHASQLGTAGLKLAGALINGMTGGLLSKGISAVEHAWSAVLSHIPAIARKLMHLGSPSKLTRWHGEMIVAGLVNGLSSNDAMRSTKRAAEDWVSVVPKTIENALEINSPSKKAIWWGQMIGVGLAQGLYGAKSSAVGAAVDLMNAVIAGGNATVATAEQKARLAQATADRASATATILQTRANKMPSATAAQKAAKKRANTAAAAAKKNADATQAAADSASSAVQAAQDFAAADTHGRGDIRTTEAKDTAAVAAKLLAKASAEATQAKRLATTNAAYAAQLRAKAKADAAAAARYAAASANYEKSALAYYDQEVKDRIQAMRDQQAADAKAKADQAELDAATDPQAKADILNKRADALEAQGATLKAAMESYIAQAQAKSAKDAVAAMALLDKADQAATDAKQAADDAAADRQAAQDALGNTGSTGSTTTDLTPSRSVLEDAARVVDSYSASLQLAQEAAQVDQPVFQFTQNNTSPQALSVSEIYRKTNNLMSLAQLKMGAK